MPTGKRRKLSFKIWIETGGKPVLGKGGAEILAEIGKSESISRAAESLKMSYRYVWSYLRKIEKAAGGEVVKTFRGGRSGGGGARLTDLGENLLEDYRGVEAYLGGVLAETEDKPKREISEPSRLKKAMQQPPFQYPIVFLPCRDLEAMRAFYHGVLGLPVALDQGKCIIVRVGVGEIRGYWGFCSGLRTELSDPASVCLTLVVSSREEVDWWHKKLIECNVVCTKGPSYRREFHICNAFFRDPMGYTLEIQSFGNGYEPH